MLTDAVCRTAKPATKDRKLSDSGGLFLLVKPTGSKSWKYKYRLPDGREKKLTIGTYPQVTLAEARKARDLAREQLTSGIDPSAEKKRRKAANALAALETFEAVARAWHREKESTLTPRYAKQVLVRLEENMFPHIGALPIDKVQPPQVLEAIRKIEARGSKEMAHRVRTHTSDVFVWAIASGICQQDPAAIIRKALKPTDPKLRPARTKLKDARKVLTSTEALNDIWWATRLASRLLALTAARPGVIRLAERTEFENLDGKQPIWRIPAGKMKLTRERKRDAAFEFVMPLSRQSVETVKAAMEASPSPQWLFPGIGSWRKPISDSTLSKHYRDAGLAGRHVPHGWRSSFSTIMNERAAVEDRERDRAIIDLMLAHVPEGVEAAYNRAAYMPRRRELAQVWADLLMDGMPLPGTLIPR
ncbi:integrase arm-type DNA-binding domain-containing protein [uncultured Croceicoccus sp.]|uniref:tyrosine-type recombinase/integrase n=1 Tax=uncultured Croceicoccus sp. TaxID=1295329 RepID=UPI00261262DC|nr:integrase arm-type DNA-binding domain-containing protein [uncultured Croceicoccus sp.]